ncbi:MAG: EAL domain-containing protein [Candidatus Omnitrophota bacterium]
MVSKKRILVVDDESTVRQTMSMMLETRGYEVNVAETGQDAINRANDKPDLILLDLILPDFEGFEVCRRLREDKSTRHIPIIIVSVKYLFEDKIEGLYLGADDYITKPFEYEELFARIDSVLRRSLFFDESNSNREAVVFELKRIIKEQLIVSFFQPIFFLKPFTLFGYEALSRPPATSILSNPDLLFKAALRFGLYSDLELLSWRKAIEAAVKFKGSEKIFLNCNPYLVESPKFFKIKSLFEEVNMSPRDVVLEITERSAISDFKAFYKRLKSYRDYGFEIAIDDVGGGYASLESIVETKPKIVKIDTHLISDLENDPLKRSLIKFVVRFCRENHIIAVAEGIERKQDLDILLDLGVDAGQGYLLCRPAQSINLNEQYKDIHVRLGLDVPSSVYS